MKKRLVALLILALVMVLSLTSCGDPIGDWLNRINPPEEYAVYFIAGDGVSVPSQTVKEGELVTKPTDPTLHGYEFDGWYKDDAYTTPWNFESDVVKQNTLIYAKWVEHVHVGGTATCTSGPICESCGEEYGEALGHKGGTATCTDLAVCEVCGESYGNTLSHTEEILAAVAPTCTETGLTEGKKCSVCGEILVAQEEVPATGHSFGDWIVDVEPTIGAEGSKHRECACGEIETATIPAIDHTHSYTSEVTTEAGCETDGVRTYTCSCGDSYTEVIPATGHSFGDWIVDVEPTIGAEGSKHRECACGEIETETIPAIDHTHSYTSEVTTAAGCETDGVRTYTCSCGDSYTEAIPATGHTDETIEAVAPTCEGTGLTEGKKCSVCGEILVAQEEVEALGHEWDEGEVTKAATYGHAGTMKYTCTRDNTHTKTETIAKLVLAADATPAEIVDAAYSLAKDESLSNKQTLTGVIVQVDTAYDSGYKNVTVTIKVNGVDETKLIMCYRMKGTGADTIGAGDTITVSGIIKNYNGTIEFDSGCTLDSYTIHEHTFTEATCETKATCSLCGITEGELADHVYENGVCKVCGLAKGVETTTVTYTASTQGYANAQDVKSITLDANASVAIVSGGAQNSTKYYNSGSALRVYPKNTFTFSVAEGCTIVSIKITSPSGYTITASKAVLTNATGEYNGTVVTLTPVDGSKDVSFQFDPTATSGQCRISSIEVVYASAVTEPECEHEGGKATCLEKAVCDKCGEFYGELGGHTEVVDSSVDATCEGTGLTEGKHCSVCNTVLVPQETVDALGHTDGEAVVEKDVKPTCTTAGSYDTVVYCTVCEKELSRKTTTVDALGHTWGNWIVDTPATEEADGAQHRVCGTCGEVEEGVIPSIEHVHSYTPTVTDPTCTEQGYTTHTCRCGDSYVDTYVDALGHTNGEAVVEKDVKPTCTTAGSYDSVVYCTVCEVEVSRTTVPVDALGHDYDEVVTAPTCTTKGYTTHTCSVCGDTYTDNEVDALGHTWNEGEVTKAATYGHAGTMKYTCTRDNTHTKTETIAKLVLAADATPAEIVDAAYSLAKDESLTNKQTLTGVIIVVNSAYSTQYNNIEVTIKVNGADETKLIKCYRMKGTGADKIGVGDTITVSGIIKNYNGTIEFDSGCTLDSYTIHEHTFSEATCETKATCSICGITDGELADHVYENGVCKVCGLAEGVSTETITKTNLEIAAIAGVKVGQNTGVISGKEIALDDNITIICAKGKSTSDPCIYSESIRLYQGGATLTIKGTGMKTIVITLANTDGDGPISVTGGTADNANAPTNLVYTITVDEGVSEVVITTKGNDKKSRLYVSDISVTYVVGGSETPSHSCEHVCDVCSKCTDAECTEDVCADKCAGHHVCADGDNNHKCDTCGETLSQCADVDPRDHECDLCGLALTRCEDGEIKNHVCEICGDKISNCADDNKDHNCDVCGAVLSKCDTDYRTHYCEYCGKKLTECLDQDSDHECDVCGLAISECVDSNNNHKCDICGDTMSKCADVDPRDHECDVCGLALTRCEDGEIKNHVCEICGDKISNCADDNKDHNCDVCGAVLSKCDTDYRTHYCEYCGKKLTECLDQDSDHECDVCGLAISECDDANKDHKCDICDDTMSKCADDDHNHYCDWCGIQNSQCMDLPPYDHNCDWCGEKVSDCEGGTATCKDKAVCEICGQPYGELANHDYKPVVTAPDCENRGYTTYTCSVCEDSYVVDYTDALGHDKEYHDAKTPTYSEAGWEAYESCKREGCGYSTKVELAYVVYLEPSAEWVQNGARFAIYFFGGNGTPWVDMSDEDGDGVYEAEIIYGHTNLIFVCMNSNTANDWNNKVAQTADLSLSDAGNCYRVVDNAGVWYNYPCAHEYSEVTCTEDAVCGICGHIGTVAPGHTWAEEVWTVVTAPTTEADGVKSRECSVCGTVTDAILRQAEVKPILYLTPNSNWKQSNARFAAYFFGNGEKWVSMTYNSELKVYEVEVPAGYPNVIFCRMNPSTTANNWDNKWNQTADLKVPADGTNHYTVKAGTWDKGGGTWTTTIAPVEHEHVYYPATCTTVQTCYQCDATYGELGEHNYGEWIVAVPSTCKATGTLGHYACSVCEKNFDIDKNELESLIIDIDPDAHFDGEDENSNCDYCQASLCTEHAWNDGEVVTEATCVTAGSEKFTCTACGTTETRTVNALGHDYSAEWTVDAPATCTEAGSKSHHCSRCDSKSEVTEIPATGHIYNKTVVTPATCTEAGYITITCRNCEKSFVSGKDAEADQYLIDYPFFKLDVLGHDMVTDEAVAPTCTETGLTEGSHCSRCDDVTTAQEVVPALGHTDKDDNNICDVEDCKEILCGENDHVENDGEVTTPATCVAKGVRTYSCSACGKELRTEEIPVDPNAHNIVEMPAKDKTCTEDGHSVYDACTLCDYEDGKNVIKAPGHFFKTDVVAKAATCTEDGYTATERCMVCDYTKGNETIPALGHRLENWIQLDPTCTEAGYTAHQRCSREGCGYTSPYFDLAPKGHTAGETVVENNTPATCTDDGSYDNVVYCTVCKVELERKTVTVDALGHTEVVDKAVDPTCTATGLTEGKHCDACGKVLVAQEEVPALGHDEYDLEEKAATCEEDGYEGGTGCHTCGEIVVAPSVITALGHKHTNGNVICDNCGLEKQESWTLVTNVSQLVVGGKVVIVAKNSAVALSTTQNTNNRGQVAVTKNGNTVTLNSNVQILTLQSGNTTGTWALHTGSGYLYAAGGTGKNNYLKTTTSLNATSSWNITITSAGVATIKTADSTVARHTLMYNSQSALFSCYASGQAEVVLYMQNSGYVNHVHTEKTLSAKAPTCENTGLTEGKQCTVCGEVTVAQTEIPATGHNYVIDTAVAPTCQKTGLTEGTHCANGCGIGTVDQEEVPVIECNFVNGVCTMCGVAEAHVCSPAEAVEENRVEATCTKDGSYDMVVYCEGCGEEKERETFTIKSEGHNYVNDVCTKCGEADPNAAPVKAFTLTKDNFNTTSYAANNTTKTINGYSYTSYQVMQQSSKMQWQKSKGYITFVNPGFKKLELVTTGGTFTVTIGGKTISGKTSNGVTTYDFTGYTGDVKIAVGSATGYVTSITMYK